MTDPKILLLSCYELGHQPLSLAWPLAFFSEAGLPAGAVDLAIDPFPDWAAEQADLIAIAVPMHTAMRLGVQAARRARTLNPRAHICFYGLYAWLNASFLLGDGTGNKGRPLADSVIAGEGEQVLVALAQALAQGRSPRKISGVTTAALPADPVLARLPFPVPARSNLPSLTQYAHFFDGDRVVPAGYVEASRGCLHRCTHCPVVPIYDGRFFIVPVETVLADIRQQVAAGAGHITFGDPDFLNGPNHALRVAREMHAEFPSVTFDFTTKVEHILEKQVLIPELRHLGAAFVVSAFESVSDAILDRLDKGHTVTDLDLALDILAEASLPVQPTWVPFTPWTTLDDYLALLAWVRRRGLISHVPAVQLAIRLLVPPGSRLLEQPDVEQWIGPLDEANFNYCWQHPDPQVDALQQQILRVAEHQVENGEPYEIFTRIEWLAHLFAERPVPTWESPTYLPVPPPRLTENWFC